MGRWAPEPRAPERPRSHGWNRNAIAVIASAALFGIAFPPYPFVIPVFICLVPITVTTAGRADADGSARDGAHMGFWFGLIGYGINLYWIAVALAIYTKLALLGYIAAVLILAGVLAATVAILLVVRRRTRLPMALLLPVVWVASELLLNHLADLSFPWLPLGLAVSRLPVLAQIADLSGVHGVSFWIAAINGLLADAWLLRGRRGAASSRLVIVAAAIVVVTTYGAWRLYTIRLRPLAPIAIVQPNIPQEEKWQAENRGRIVGILSSLTRQAVARRDARLIVWPEAALPGFLPEHPEWADTLAHLATLGNVPLLVGALDATRTTRDDVRYYNAAMLTDTTGAIDWLHVYHKTYLVPVVERVPFFNPAWFARLKWFGGYSRGSAPSIFRLPFGNVGVLICYESAFAARSRFYRRRGADLLINITNDAWFGRTVAPDQHAAHLVLRAIENRVGIVRAANTGISEYVDPLGRVHGATSLFTTAVRTYPAATTAIRPLYVRLGDWIGTGSVVMLLTLLLLPWRRRQAPPRRPLSSWRDVLARPA